MPRPHAPGMNGGIRTNIQNPLAVTRYGEP